MNPTLVSADPGMSETLRENIATLQARREAEARERPVGDKIAAAITRFTGSMAFVYIHLGVYGAWILINLGLVPGVAPFDPTFVILASEASVEAIFLSTFVLISQNRMAASADRRADLDLHINLLTEHEITRIAHLLHRVADKLEISLDDDPAFQEVKQDIEPIRVLDELEDKRVEAEA